MGKLILLSIALMMSACSRSDYVQDTDMFNSVDPKLQIYFDRFTADTGVSTSGITGGFTDLSSNIVGECVYNGSYREVRIDNTYWSQISTNDILMEQIVLHELGHCALSLGHIPDLAPNGQPLSIMNPYVFSPLQGIYLKSRETDYITALVNNVPISYP